MMGSQGRYQNPVLLEGHTRKIVIVRSVTQFGAATSVHPQTRWEDARTCRTLGGQLGMPSCLGLSRGLGMTIQVDGRLQLAWQR